MGFGHLNADPAITGVAPSGLFVGHCLCPSTGMGSWSKCDRVTREISEVMGRLVFCRFPTWSLSVRYDLFVYETEVELFFFSEKFI